MNNHFTVASLPSGEKVIGRGKKVALSRPDPAYRYVFFHSDFFLSEKNPWWHFEHTEVCTESSYSEIPSLTWFETTQEHYLTSYKLLQKEIANKKVKKGVPYTFFSATSRTLLPQDLLSQAMNAPQGYLYGTSFGNQGCIGVSPERLFSIENQKLQVDCCAGTFQAGEKTERFKEEHQFVVDGVLEALSSFGKPKIFPQKILEYSHISHLLTKIECPLEIHNIDQVIEALHPTGAIGAYPKKTGNQWLKDIETFHPRGSYGAPFGVIDQEEKTALFVPMIRGISWEGNQFKIGVGGGVVEESIYEKEREELFRKLTQVKALFSL